MHAEYYTCEQLISIDIYYLAFVSNVGEKSFVHQARNCFSPTTKMYISYKFNCVLQSV